MSCNPGHEWAENPDFLGPMGLDYCYVYQSFPAGISFLGVFLILVWVFFFMNLLAQTASNYFSPTLSTICDKLKIPYDIAGVTFLALGNGAPDFFSLIASFSGGVDVLVGVGALLGGSMFVCTVVVGSIAILCPCDVSRKVFLRDITFHLSAVVLVGFIAIIKHVHVGLAITLILSYIGYAAIVMFTSIYGSPEDPIPGVEEDLIGGDISLRLMSNNSAAIQTAFWHPQPSNSKLRKKQDNGSKQEEYSFMFLQDTKEGDESHRIEDGTINLSGGFAPCFDEIIQEDYYGADHVDQAPFQEQEVTMDEGLGMESSMLQQSLLGNRPPSRSDSVSSRRFKASNYSSMLSALYWQQWALRRKFQHSALSSEWDSYSFPYKLLLLLEHPVTVARDITIPTLDEGNWNKLYAMIHPIADPLFFCYIFGIATNNFMETLTVCAFVGAIPSFCIFLVAPNNKPPTSSFFVLPWTLTAFVMCVAWIYMLAGELITALSVLGIILKLPPAFLGLTILAWGNSVGDFFTNTAVAKQGLGAMALAGCYAGPVFNILVGFGTALVFASSQTFPNTYRVELDASSKLSLVFLVIALTSSIGIVSFNGFKLERGFGMYLLTLYGVYSACQGLLLLMS